MDHPRMPSFNAALKETPLGFGCSGPLGARWFSERKFKRLIEKALQAGVRYFDTAGFYGIAQDRLGRALWDIGVGDKGDVFISTKIGTRRGPNGQRVKDFSPKAIVTAIEQAQSALRRERIDMLFMHGPTMQEITEAAPTLESAKAGGQIGAIGYCGDDPTVHQAAVMPLFDAVMAPYNLLNRQFEDDLRRAKQAQKTVIAISPLAQGRARNGLFLPRSLTDGWYLARRLVKTPAKPDENSRRIDALLQGKDGDGAARLLSYVLSRPFIDVALTISSRPANIDRLGSLARRDLSMAAREELDDLADQITHIQASADG